MSKDMDAEGEIKGKTKKPKTEKASGDSAGSENKESSKADAKSKESAKATKDSSKVSESRSKEVIEAPAASHKVDHFEGERVKVEVTHEPRCRVSMKVSAVGPLMNAAKKDAIRKIAKEVSIPGFRKGKAPASLIEKKFARDLAQGWEREFANLSFKEAQALARIPLLNGNGNGNITYKMEKLTGEEGKIVFHFETEPLVPELDYDLFDLKDTKKVTVDDEKIDETIKSIRMFYATWDQVTDRAVQESDFVILDIDDMDQDPPVQAFSNTRFEVSKSGMATWMRDLVLGKKLEESAEGISEPEKTDSEEVKNSFQKKKVRLHIKGIEHANLPPLDDDLAMRVGVKSVAELRERLQELLSKQANEMHDKELRDSIGEQLIAKISFDIPGSVLEKEANHRLSHMLRNASFAKKWKESMSEEEKNQQKAEVTKQSENAIRLFYLCRAIVTKNNLSLSDEELHPTYSSILEMMFADPNKVNYQNQSKEQQAIEFSKFMMAKAQDFIVSKVLDRAAKA